MKGPALQNMRVGVLRMVSRGRKVFGTFEKRAPAGNFKKNARLYGFSRRCGIHVLILWFQLSCSPFNISLGSVLLKQNHLLFIIISRHWANLLFVTDSRTWLGAQRWAFSLAKELIYNGGLAPKRGFLFLFVLFGFIFQPCFYISVPS